MPQTINKPGYWYDQMLDQFMRLSDTLNQRGQVDTFVKTPGYQLNSNNQNVFGPNGIPRPGVELLPPSDITELIMQMKK